MINLDLAALRTFMLAADLGGFGKAARKLHRTPGAVSLQLKTLEERIAAPLFMRQGRKQQLTASGEVLLVYARQLLRKNDEALLAIKDFSDTGQIRFGMTQDLADGWLPHTLAQFSRDFPAIRLELRVGSSTELAQAVADDDLDLGLMFGPCDPRSRTQAARLGMRWFASESLDLPASEPVPLLLLAAPCMFRDTVIRALDEANRSWRIVLESNSVSAIWEAVKAGLGVTARTPINAPRSLVVNKELPVLGDVGLYLRRTDRPKHSAVAHLADRLQETIAIKSNMK